MRKKYGLILILLVLFAGYYFWEDINDFYSQVTGRPLRLTEQAASIEQLETEVLAPPPLRLSEGSPAANLTISGVVEWTNHHRQQNDLSPLTVHPRLGQTAELKVSDMLADQYFAHISPEGIDASDLAEQVRYEFIAIGENLALGNFDDDQSLVAAWMDSPGHRENILKPEFEEIGVAVRKGVFDGEETWVAVQIFGRPLSACPAPDLGLEAQIQQNQQQIEQLKITMEQKEQEVEDAESSEERDEKVDEYNALVQEHNRLVRETRALVNDYNSQVQAYNACARG